MGKPSVQAKSKVHWWEDAYGRYTCHSNDRGLDFEESLLGELVYLDERWYFLVKGKESRVGPFSSSKGAKDALRDALCVEIVDIWD